MDPIRDAVTAAVKASLREALVPYAPRTVSDFSLHLWGESLVSLHLAEGTLPTTGSLREAVLVSAPVLD